MFRISIALIALAIAAVLPPAAAAAAADDGGNVKAIALFKQAFAGRCAEKAFSADYLSDVEGIVFTYSPSFPSGEPQRRETLYQFFCDNYAHAGSAVFILKNHDGNFAVLSFAQPYIRYSRDAGAEDSVRKESLAGFSSVDILMNPEFDPETRTMATSYYDNDGEYYENWIFEDDMFVFTGSDRYLFEDGALKTRPAADEE